MFGKKTSTTSFCCNLLLEKLQKEFKVFVFKLGIIKKDKVDFLFASFLKVDLL